jgi:hypothetical protein
VIAQDGALVVLHPTSEELWHLPSRPLVGAPIDAPTRCGLEGLVYAYGPVFRRQRRLCAVCRDRSPKGDLVYTTDGEFIVATKPKRRHRRRVPQFTDAHVQLLHKTYVEKHVGMWALAELVWQRMGFRNQQSCANAIHRAFIERGLPIRPRSESHQRTNEGRRLLGFGGHRDGERRLDARTVDRLYRLYGAGFSSPEICQRLHARFGYVDAVRFRSVLEYAWKTSGYRLRTSREAELLSRAKAPTHCIGTTSTIDGSRPHPCPQRPLKDSEHCYHHDPRFADERAAHIRKIQSRIKRAPSLEFELIRPHLDPLLVPRSRKERAAGALHRQTGVPGSVCSRLLNGSKKRLSVANADRLLAPLGLTVAQLTLDEEVAA